MSDDNYERIIDNFKEIFTDIPLDTRRSIMESNINKLVKDSIPETMLTNHYSLASNIIKLIIEEKLVDVNYILSMLIKHTKNEIGLFMIGMVFRLGANPNVYFPVSGYGNIHILCALSLRLGDLTDFYFRYIIQLLKVLGSNINYPAYNLKESDTSNLDVNYVEKVAEEVSDDQNLKMTVGEFVRSQGKLPDEDFTDFLDSIEDEKLLDFTIAYDNVELFQKVVELDYFKSIFNTDSQEAEIVSFFLNISTANALNIANEITDKIIPTINTATINTQRIPIYTAVISSDLNLFKLLARKGSSIKYVSITQLIANYKKYKRKNLKIYNNNFWMLLEAVNIGADIDIYQFDLFTSTADYDEIEEIKKAYDVPKWKKLCAVTKEDETRQEIKQIAFELNLDYNMKENEICNKIKQISLLDKNQFLESAIKRQEDRITVELSNINQFTGGGKPPVSRCSKKSTIIKNPYAYNDTRMAFYRDPDDNEIWCFTSDTFSNLIASKINPYTGKELPDKFIETLKAQINILVGLGLFNFNNSIKDTLKEYFNRSIINNKKTDYSYNTVVKCLSLYGLSEEKLNSLGENSLNETILNDICNVNLTFFDSLTPKHQVIITTRIIYSLSKNMKEPANFYETISRAVIGNLDEITYDQDDQDDQEENTLNNYMSMLE